MVISLLLFHDWSYHIFDIPEVAVAACISFMPDEVMTVNSYCREGVNVYVILSVVVSSGLSVESPDG
jgi:hypothetical protein